MDINELSIYEMPWIAEFIGFSWGQEVIAKYLAWKVTRKIKRYEKRKLREKFLKEYFINK